jgi:RNA polymerase sigma-70 factor (ECF subfamily)
MVSPAAESVIAQGRFCTDVSEPMTVSQDDSTQIGGHREAFLTTHWSLIEGIQAGDNRDSALIGLLLERYWKPVYCYLRRRGYHNEQAKDLTQGFFHDVVLNRNLVGRADQAKGRFRTFLLHALNQYVINENAKETAGKRIPRQRFVALEVADLPTVPSPIFESEPEDSYNYAWVSALMDQILETVRIRCCDEGLATHWCVFDERVVQPIFGNTDPPSLSDICAHHGIADPQQASNMIVTVKRRFRSALREHIRTTVVAEDQVDDELREILRFLPDVAQDLS